MTAGGGAQVPPPFDQGVGTMKRHLAAALVMAGLLAGAWPASASPDLVWRLRNTASAGSPNAGVFSYGDAGPRDRPVVGDWDGDGNDTVGFVRPLSNGSWLWALRNSNSSGNASIPPFQYGNTELDFPIVGDWDGDGVDEAAVVRRYHTGQLLWLLLNENAAGQPDVFFFYGRWDRGDRPVAGDWSNAGVDRHGVVRREPGGRLHWLLALAFGPTPEGGMPQAGDFEFGSWKQGDRPVRGNWDGGNAGGPGSTNWDTVGVVRPTSNGLKWMLRNANSMGTPHVSFLYGNQSLHDRVVTGNWNGAGDTIEGIGVVR